MIRVDRLEPQRQILVFGMSREPMPAVVGVDNQAIGVPATDPRGTGVTEDLCRRGLFTEAALELFPPLAELNLEMSAGRQLQRDESAELRRHVTSTTRSDLLARKGLSSSDESVSQATRRSKCEERTLAR